MSWVSNRLRDLDNRCIQSQLQEAAATDRRLLLHHSFINPIVEVRKGNPKMQERDGMVIMKGYLLGLETAFNLLLINLHADSCSNKEDKKDDR